MAFLLVDHHWAAPLFDAIAETGGTLIGEGFLTAEAGLVVGAEVAAMEEASEVIAQAQADEAGALLAAAAARAEAAEAVAESEQIKSARRPQPGRGVQPGPLARPPPRIAIGRGRSGARPGSSVLMATVVSWPCRADHGHGPNGDTSRHIGEWTSGMSTRYSLMDPPTMASLRSAAVRDVDHDASAAPR